MTEAAVSEQNTYNAQPQLKLAGKPAPNASAMVLTMEMVECEGGMSSLELRLSNVPASPTKHAPLAFEDEKVFGLGDTIEVHAGDVRCPQEIFRGWITGVELEMSQEAPPEIVILAEDALQRARMTRRTKMHTGLQISSLADAIAQRCGLKASVDGFSGAIGDWMQLDESDLSFLRRVLRAYDGDLQVVADQLHVAPRGSVRRADVALELFGQLRRCRVTADLAHQVTETTVSGWDPVQSKRVAATSRGVALGPGAGRTGASILDQKIGKRPEHVGRQLVLTGDEAKARADAAFDQRARGFVRIEGTAEGNTTLRVGSHVRVSGVSDRFDNTYYVTRACHRFDLDLGYETDFEAECAYLGEP